MPRYIGYRSTGTANSSVTNSPARGGNVDKKFSSGLWTINNVYDKRKNRQWPFFTATPDIDFEIWGAGGGGAEQPAQPGRQAGGGGGGYMKGTIPGAQNPGTVYFIVGDGGLGTPAVSPSTVISGDTNGGPGDGWRNIYNSCGR